MAADSEFQPRLGTVLATFTQTGTYSNQLQLNGRLMGLYSDNWPSAAGSIDFRASWTPGGTGYKVQTPDGTVLKLSAFGSGTAYSIGNTPMFTAALGYTTLQIGTAGTAGVAAGGTMVLITEHW
jgi:hypothetical protein